MLDIDCSDPDVLFAWLQGRGEVAYRNQKPLRLHGEVSVAADRITIDALKAELNGGAVEGRVALATLPSGGSRLEAALKADNLDLDAAGGFIRSLQAEWPDEASVALDVGRAISAGQELKPLTARLTYTPKDIILDRARIGSPDNIMLEGGGNFDRVHATGKLTLAATSASMVQLAGVITPLSPQIAARLTAANTAPRTSTAPSLELQAVKATSSDRVAASAELDLDAPQLKGQVSASASPLSSSIRAVDLDALSRSEVNLRAKFSAERGDALLALLGLDHAVAAAGSLQFEGSANGMFRQPLRLSAKMWGANIDAEAQGTTEPWSQKANLNLKIRSVNLAPLVSLKPSDRHIGTEMARFVRQSRRANKCSSLDDLDSVAAGSRLRGHLVINLDEPREIDGELGVDALALLPAVALAIGAAGHGASEPLGAGLFRGWRGNVGFEALSATLPGDIELRPLGGTVKSDGQSLQLEALKGKIGGGDVNGSLDARSNANGLTLNARVELAGVDGAALHYRGLKMPTGRTSAQMALMSQGRSLEALTGALSGNGTVKLESAADCRHRSARARRRDPRQRFEPGARRHQVAAGRRFRTVRGRLPRRFRGISLHHPRRTASRRRDDAGDPGRARHRVRRLRHSRGSGRYSRKPGFDRDRLGDQPSGDSAVRGGAARYDESHDRRDRAVVMACGAQDRSRNAQAGCDRARRAAAGRTAAAAAGDSGIAVACCA